MSPDENDKIKHEMEKIEKEFQNTHEKILETLKMRKKVEKDYGNTIKMQKEYWESQLKYVDPLKDKNRYKELKENIRREENLLKQIKEEVNRINKEIKMEKEHKQSEKEKFRK